MGRTKHVVKGKVITAKTRKKPSNKKHFGFTSGTHSQFEAYKAEMKKTFEETDVNSPWYAINKKRWEVIKDKSYPEKGVDFVKYGYGNGRNKNKS